MTRSKKFRPWFSHLGILLAAGLLVFAGVGCDDSDSSFAPSAPETQVGVFADAPVDGIEYATETRSGVTANGGEFLYVEGETVTFFIGGIVLGGCQAGPVVTPVDLVEDAEDEQHPAVVNIVRFLMTLDADDNLDNGILITGDMVSAAVDLTLDFTVSTEAFEKSHQVEKALYQLSRFRGKGIPRGLLRKSLAIVHLHQTLLNLELDPDFYTDDDEDGASEWEGDCDDSDADAQPGNCPEPPEDSVTLDNGFTIAFTGVDYNENGTSTWNYSVQETENAQDLSNWVLGLPECAANEAVMSVSPVDGSEAVGPNPDPNANLIGVKWNTGAGFESGEFSVTVDGYWDIGTIQVAAKGPDVALGELQGPFCAETSPGDEDGDNYTVEQGDADDNDPTIYPGAPEICGNNVDEDQDGEAQSCLTTGLFLLGRQGVEGLSYETYTVDGAVNIVGVTDEDGHFDYLTGEDIAFFIGDIELGRIEAQPVITPMKLAPGASMTTGAVVNIARLLMSLDDDGFNGNGVVISAAVQQVAVGVQIDFSVMDLLAELRGLIGELTAVREVGPGGLVIVIKVKDLLEETDEIEDELTEDSDEDGFSVAEGDCDDGNADINPDAEEVCDDDIDWNCDGNAGCEEVVDTVLLSNGFEITYDGVDYNDDDTSTWHYTVRELPEAQDLSNWVLELPECAAGDAVVSVYPTVGSEVKSNPDPNAGLIGVKWNTGAGFLEGSFSVTVMGHWTEGTVGVAAKGPDVVLGAIAGPSCEVFEAVDADNDGCSADVDCDDNDPTVHPMAEEILGNDIDENCDGEAPAEDFLPLDGNWKTPADFDGPFIGFTVKGDEVKTLLLKVEDDCVGSDVVTAGNARLEIEENLFTFTTSEFDLSGGFDSETEASGTYYAVNACGDELTGEWAAELVSSDGDDVDDDGDNYTENEGDADDSDPNVNPAAKEICGNGIDEDGDGVIAVCPDEETALKGYFIYGGGVAGLGYYTETLEGVTGEDGLFYFHEGETVTFFIGDLTFGAAAPAFDETEEIYLVTPVDLFGAVDKTAPTVVNFCRFLISLDNNGDPSDGIFVPLLVRIMAMDFDVSFDMDVDLFEDRFAELIVLLTQYREAGSNELALSSLVEYLFGVTFGVEGEDGGFFFDDDGDNYSEFDGDCDDEDPSVVFPDEDGVCGDPAPSVEELVQGDWTGETDQGEAISFRLRIDEQQEDEQQKMGEVHSLFTTLNYQGDFSPDCVAGNLLFTEGLRVPLVGDAFIFSTDRAALTGVFTSPTTVEGTWFYQNETCEGAGNGVWTAEISPEDADKDGDGYTEAEGDIRLNGETADDDPTIYPGAPEICGDGIDQDLDGVDLICPELTEEDITGNLFLNMTFVNMPRKEAFQSAHITIEGIQIRVKGGRDKDKTGWQFFGALNQSFALSDFFGDTATLAQALLQSGFDGEHHELRLFLTENIDNDEVGVEDSDDFWYNYIIDKDGVKHPLKLDKRSKEHGVKVKHHFRIRKDRPTCLLLEMDVHKSIKKKKHGWELKPHFKIKACEDIVFVGVIDDDYDDEGEDDDKRRRLDAVGGII